MQHKYLELFECRPEAFNVEAQQHLLDLSSSPQRAADIMKATVDISELIDNASLTLTERYKISTLLTLIGSPV